MVQFHTLGAFLLLFLLLPTPPWLCLLRLGSSAPPFHCRLMPSLVSLGSGASLYGSSSFLSEVFLHCPDFSSSSSSWLVFLGFLLCAPGSHSLCLFVPCVCTALGPSSSFLPPSSLDASSLGVLCPLLPFCRSWSSLPGVMLPLLFIVTPGVPCRSSVWFLIFLSSLLALMASSSSVNSLPSSAGFSYPLVARRLGVPPSRHPWIHLLVGGWSSSMALLLHGLLTPTLHLAISGSFSISLGLPPLLRCLVAPWGFLLFAWATGGFVQCSLLSLCRVASTFLFPFCNPSSYGLHPNISMSAFPGYCLFRSSALLFLFFCMGAWSTCLVFLPCVSLLGFHSFLFPSGHLFMSFLGALLTRSNLLYTTRRGLPLGRVSFWLASWNFVMVPIPHGSPLLLLALLLVPTRSCAGVFLAFDFLLGSFPFTWAPTCCFLCLLSVPSVCPPLAPILALARVSHYFSVFSLLVPRSNLSSFATGSSLRAESLLSGFSYIFSHGSLLVHFS